MMQDSAQRCQGVSQELGIDQAQPWFEAPNGPHQWLNEAVFTGTLAPVPGRTDAIIIRVFKIV